MLTNKLGIACDVSRALWAAALALSDFVVISNALRLYRWKE